MSRGVHKQRLSVTVLFVLRLDIGRGQYTYCQGLGVNQVYRAPWLYQVVVGGVSIVDGCDHVSTFNLTFIT